MATDDADDRDHAEKFVDNMLCRWYVDERLSRVEIADRADMSESELVQLIRERGILRRDQIKYTYKTLEKDYSQESLTITEIAERDGHSSGEVKRHLVFYGLY